MSADGILPFDAFDGKAPGRRRPAVLGSLTAVNAALDTVLDLFDPARRPAEPDLEQGYVDLLGDDDPTGSLPGQRLMISTVVPRIYERWWRPPRAPAVPRPVRRDGRRAPQRDRDAAPRRAREGPRRRLRDRPVHPRVRRRRLGRAGGRPGCLAPDARAGGAGGRAGERRLRARRRARAAVSRWRLRRGVLLRRAV